jgi:polysaccharide export outer membrane protein
MERSTIETVNDCEALAMIKNMTAQRFVTVLALFALLTVGALAQSNTASQATTPAAAASQPVATQVSTDKPVAVKPGEVARVAHSDNSYVIGADDVLAINVWKETEVSRSVTVRSDGKISLPLVGELMAGGQTPLQLEQEIAKRLQNFISEPEVTVMVQESKSQKINIMGMVVRPGLYLLTGSTTVLDAIGMAGGFKDFAKKKQIYVLRAQGDGSQKRLLFNYKDAIKGVNPEQNIRLLPGDTVVVP